MNWEDLEVGDKLRFNQEYVDDVLKNEYEYIPAELLSMRQCRDKQLEIISFNDKPLGGRKVLYIILKGLNYTYKIDPINGYDVGFGRGCRIITFIIDELRGE